MTHCSHPTCHSRGGTRYVIDSEHGEFQVCGEHLTERDIPRVVDVKGDSAAAAANAEIVKALRS